MQKLKKKFQLLEPSLKDAGHLRSTEDALLLKRLFALCAAQMITVMVNRRSEKRINIRLDRLYNAIAVYEDTRGHVESKCKKCGRITVFDVLNMRRLRPRTK